MYFFVTQPHSNSLLWWNLKTNLSTFKGCCHNEKCRARWAENFCDIQQLYMTWSLMSRIEISFWAGCVCARFGVLVLYVSWKKKAQGKFNPIKSEQFIPLISQNTQLTKLYIFHYDSVPWKFLGWFLELVKVVSWNGTLVRPGQTWSDGYWLLVWPLFFGRCFGACVTANCTFFLDTPGRWKFFFVQTTPLALNRVQMCLVFSKCV